MGEPQPRPLNPPGRGRRSRVPRGPVYTLMDSDRLASVSFGCLRRVPAAAADAYVVSLAGTERFGPVATFAP